MPSLRQDPLTGRWVIIAGQRHGRPNDFRERSRPGAVSGQSADDCPFCSGRENQTPGEVMATGRDASFAANSPGWQVRVVPNKYPAVHNKTEETESTPLHPQGAATGAHEVIVCGPGHLENLGTLPVDHLLEILKVVRQRIIVLSSNQPAARYVLAFGNQGPDAGATLAHAHLQIITTPVVPVAVVDKIENFLRHRRDSGCCLLCDIAASEEKAGTRLISGNEHWVTVAPWASRFPCEMRLIPRRHCSSMIASEEDELGALARQISFCLKALDKYRPGTGYNLIFHNTALDAAEGRGYGNDRLDLMEGYQPDIFHWHVEILPRLSRQAGFEAGTGFAINSLPPEEAAAILRPERR